MAAPELVWRTYQVPSSPAGVPKALEPLGLAAETITVEIPDLSAFPTPREKGKILLETAAEVEHALLVQYLYAAFSLKDRTEVSLPEHQAAVQQWRQVLLTTAVEEMGHLMTAQNLLLALRLGPNLEREDFPPRKDLYPFEFHLEPLSQRSLAKYVTAESPEDAGDIADIVDLATASAGMPVNHVGVIYGLLGVVFSTAEQALGGGSGSPTWDAILRRLADAAHQQSPASTWHLGDDAIDAQSVGSQANPDDWSLGQAPVHRIPDRGAALTAIRDIAEEGEGPASSGETSHFERYRRMYRGSGGIVPFPAAGQWEPARPVPTDPALDDIAEPRTRRWVLFGDLRYALLLGFIEHHLLTSDANGRRNLNRWALEEMFTLRHIARKLATLPHGNGVAALAFHLPALLHLPGSDPERWQLQRDRTDAAIAYLWEMQVADRADRDDPLLVQLLRTDTDRKPNMQGGSAPTVTTSFAGDILPLFRPIDIEHMRDFGLDLGDFDAVRREAASISARLKGIGGRRMPPDRALTPEQIGLFDRWISEGRPP